MKRLLLFILIIAAVACQRSSVAPDEILITGKIKNAHTDQIVFYIEQTIDTISLDENGKFSYSYPLQDAISGYFFYNNRLSGIYLIPGKHLDISFDNWYFNETLTYKGDIGVENDYMKWSRILLADQKIEDSVLYEKSTQEFLNHIDTVRSKRMGLLKKYLSENPGFDSIFAKNEEANIDYTWGIKHINFPGYYHQYNDELPKLDENFYKYQDELSINRGDLLRSSAYREYVSLFFDHSLYNYLNDHQDILKLRNAESVAKFRLIHELFTDDAMKNQMLYTAMKEHINNFGVDNAESFLINFEQNCTNQKYIDEIKELHVKWLRVSQGKNAPDLLAYTPQMDTLHLSDYQGYYVYLSIYTAYNQWFYQELPHYFKLFDRFKNEKIRFVNLSLDPVDNKERWEVFLTETRMPGENLLLHEADSLFSTEYIISSLPRYVLIDPEGKIINAHAPRPSEGIRYYIENLEGL